MISHHTALIYTMVLTSAADRDMTDSELGRIGEIVVGLPVFRDYDRQLLPSAASACADRMSDEDALEGLLVEISDALSPRLRETAYALAIEIAAADGHASDEELRLLEMMRHQFEIDRLIAAGIERGARARYSTG